MDGEQWILEAVVNGKYRMIDISTPEAFIGTDDRNIGIDVPDLRPFVKACEYFLELAEVSFPSRNPVKPKTRTSR